MQSELYNQWKKTAKHSSNSPANLGGTVSFERATDDTNIVNQEAVAQNNEQTESINDKYKSQFLMNKAQAAAPVHNFKDNVAFQTSNEFYQGFSKYSATKKEQEEVNMGSSAAVFLDPQNADLLDNTAKKESSIWKSSVYQDEENRKSLSTPLSRTTFAYDEEAARQVVEKKNNIRKTPISEYSNAQHNGTVFVNPKFSSC